MERAEAAPPIAVTTASPHCLHFSRGVILLKLSYPIRLEFKDCVFCMKVSIRKGIMVLSQSHSLHNSVFHFPEIRVKQLLGVPYNDMPSVIFYHGAWL